MLSRDQLSDLLKQVNVKEIAREAKVSTKTIYRLRSKANYPTYSTVEKIIDAARRLKKPASRG